MCPRSSAWIERHPPKVDVTGSNPVVDTSYYKGFDDFKISVKLYFVDFIVLNP